MRNNFKYKLFLICSDTFHYVKSIDARLKWLEQETQNKAHGVENNVVVEKLPLKTIEELRKFEELLQNQDIKNVFIHSIKGIGGRHAKDCVHRILKKIFANSLGVNCSWLGQRNNFRVCDLYSINLIKEVIISAGDTKEVDFEQYCSEWFRLSRLRLDRENKK